MTDEVGNRETGESLSRSADGNVVPMRPSIGTGVPRPSPYPLDFSLLKEGDKDPATGKTIDSLIASDEDYIVYLDHELYVQWNMNDNARLNAASGDALNRVALLEAIKIHHLHPDKVSTFRRMVGEGVARLFEHDAKAASDIFNKAERWISARNGEKARIWYLSGTSLIVVPVIALGSAWLWVRQSIVATLGSGVFELVLGTCLGAVGAWLSVIQRRPPGLDVSAGWKVHYVEGAGRIVAGLLGAFIFALAVRANLFDNIFETDNRLAFLLFLCAVAGLSERLVPGLVQRVESTALTDVSTKQAPE